MKQQKEIEQPAEPITEEKRQLFREYLRKSQTELNDIFNIGLFNEICQGYALLAMRAAGIDEKTAKAAAAGMSSLFDYCDAAEALEAYHNAQV